MRITRFLLAALVAVLASTFAYAEEAKKEAAPAVAAPAVTAWTGVLKATKAADKVTYALVVDAKTTVAVVGSEEVLKAAAALDGKTVKVEGALKDAVVTATKISAVEAPKADAPKADAPKAEAPKAAAPKAEEKK